MPVRALRRYFERFLLVSFWRNQVFVCSHAPFQEFSGANVEPKAGLFVETKSFGSNFNQNLARPNVPSGTGGLGF